MRIIAGSARGRRLTAPGDSPARPFLELARGALFNRLHGRLAGARILDLYAGSGSLALEALSRGAASAICVERNPACAEALQNNAEQCGLADKLQLLNEDVVTAVAQLDGEFDLIFADPPYADAQRWDELATSATVMETTSRLLAADGMLIFRLEKGDAPPLRWGGLALRDERTYGRSRLCWYATGEATVKSN